MIVALKISAPNRFTIIYIIQLVHRLQSCQAPLVPSAFWLSLILSFSVAMYTDFYLPAYSGISLVNFPSASTGHLVMVAGSMIPAWTISCNYILFTVKQIDLKYWPALTAQKNCHTLISEWHVFMLSSLRASWGYEFKCDINFITSTFICINFLSHFMWQVRDIEPTHYQQLQSKYRHSAGTSASGMSRYWHCTNSAILSTGIP